MNLERFLIISFIFHLLVGAGLMLLPEQQKKEAKEILTRLVSPQEFEAQQPPPPQPVMPQQQAKPLPRQKPVRPVPVPRKMRPTPDFPVSPGMGSERGKPLPEDMFPRGAGRGGDEDRPEGAPSGIEEESDKPGYLSRDKLFDPRVIGDIAMKRGGKDGLPQGSKDRPLTFDTTEYRYAGYMRKLREKIESVWEYPVDARERGVYGDLKIRFTIKKNGKLGAVELVRTSGHKSLDDAAIKALRDGEPYWPLPDEWEMDSYTILGHFIYSLYGYGIR